VDYSTAKLGQCKVWQPEGPAPPPRDIRQCGAVGLSPIPYQTGDVILATSGTFNKNTPTFLQQVRRPVAMPTEI